MFAKLGHLLALVIIVALFTNNVAAITTHLRGLEIVKDDSNTTLVIQPHPEACAPGIVCYVEGSLCTDGTETCCGQTYDSLLCDCVSADGDGGKGFQYMCVNLDACTDKSCDVIDDTTNSTHGNNTV